MSGQPTQKAFDLQITRQKTTEIRVPTIVVRASNSNSFLKSVCHLPRITDGGRYFCRHQEAGHGHAAVTTLREEPASTRLFVMGERAPQLCSESN